MRRRIETLDPVRDCHEITRLGYRYEFPFDHARASELALLRTFAVPRIARVLQQSGEFVKRTQRRVDDTEILLSVLVSRGFDHPDGRTVLRKMNRMHGRFAIENELHLYVLSTFVMEPLRWNARHGYRRMSALEQDALFHFWIEVGRRMGISDLPADLTVMDRFNREFEQREMYYEPANHVLCETVVGSLLGRIPKRLRPIYRTLMVAMMDAPLRRALGYRTPPAPVLRSMGAALRIRAVVDSVLPHREPPTTYEITRASYPEGFEVEQVGADMLGSR